LESVSRANRRCLVVFNKLNYPRVPRPRVSYRGHHPRHLGPYCISPLPNDQSSRLVSTSLIHHVFFRTPPSHGYRQRADGSNFFLTSVDLPPDPGDLDLMWIARVVRPRYPLRLNDLVRACRLRPETCVNRRHGAITCACKNRSLTTRTIQPMVVADVYSATACRSSFKFQGFDRWPRRRYRTAGGSYRRASQRTQSSRSSTFARWPKRSAPHSPIPALRLSQY